VEPFGRPRLRHRRSPIDSGALSESSGCVGCGFTLQASKSECVRQLSCYIPCQCHRNGLVRLLDWCVSASSFPPLRHGSELL
jgi:hypothetical protein